MTENNTRHGNSRRIWALVLLGFLATTVLVVAVPTLLISIQYRSHYFWHRVGWTEFLVFLLWGYLGYFLNLTTKRYIECRATPGVLPALGIVIAFYALASFGLMSLHALFPSVDFLDRFHFAAQIIVATLSIIVCALVHLARVSHADAEDDAADVKPPKQNQQS